MTLRVYFKWITIAVLTSLGLSSCSPKKNANKNQISASFADQQLKFATQQLGLLYSKASKADSIPRALYEDGRIHWLSDYIDWTEGFFPGELWYIYEYTGDDRWASRADYMQAKFYEHRKYATHHDLGFIFNCSFGNGYRLTKREVYKRTLIDAANSLFKRYDPRVGCIKSWDADKGWQAERGWQYPVIIDNMMNLELLFKATELTGNNKYEKAAISHADATMINHFRTNFSCYHVVDYDSITGVVRSKQTAQGYAHESEWARGQAWALYGYTVMYRYTKENKYLDFATKIANYILTHPQLPADKIPYWDFSAPNIPREPRDVSAASLIASALLELDGYTDVDFKTAAQEILETLSSDDYQSKVGESNGFLLQHSVGSIPHKSEIDVPIIYADYYYLEALLRLKKANEQ